MCHESGCGWPVRVRGIPQPVPLKEVDFPLLVVLRQEVKNGG